MTIAQRIKALDRVCDVVDGTKILNCILHMHLDLDLRPASCVLCTTDIKNRLSDAIAVNKWLNTWKDEAQKLLSEIAVSTNP